MQLFESIGTNTAGLALDNTVLCDEAFMQFIQELGRESSRCPPTPDHSLQVCEESKSSQLPASPVICLPATDTATCAHAHFTAPEVVLAT